LENELLRSKKAKKITLTGFWVNMVLAVFKVFAGIMGKSGAMIADGIHSLSDFFTDVIVLIGFKYTQRPEDECHNYGHNKYETMATMIISIFLFVAGFEILKTGVENIIKTLQGGFLPRPGYIALIAAFSSIVAKEYLYRITKTVGKKINSTAVIANAHHHRSDALSSIGTLVGIGGAIAFGEGWTVLDPIASVLVGFFIFRTALGILKPAANELLEMSLSEEEKDNIKNILVRNDDVKSFHKLRTRRVGNKAVIETHILVENYLDVKAAHDIASDIERDFKDSFGDSCIVTIHMEPLEEELLG